MLKCNVYASIIIKRFVAKMSAQKVAGSIPLSTIKKTDMHLKFKTVYAIGFSWLARFKNFKFKHPYIQDKTAPQAKILYKWFFFSRKCSKIYNFFQKFCQKFDFSPLQKNRIFRTSFCMKLFAYAYFQIFYFFSISFNLLTIFALEINPMLTSG